MVTRGGVSVRVSIFVLVNLLALSGCGGGGSSTTQITPTAPAVSMTAVSGITQTGATSGGNVTSDGNATVTARGVVWSTNANPTTADSRTSDGAGTGAFTSTLSGLTANTTYHIRAYATNSVGTAYTADTTFTTLANLPTVSTTAASSITTTTAAAGGNVTADGGASVTARGVAFGTSANPTTSNSVTSDGTGTGSFTSSLTGLASSTTYHIRAYATNSGGTAYGSDLTFTTATPAVPTVTAVTPGSITKSTASSGGSVTDDGGATVTARGVVWGAGANPTTADSKTVDGSGTGAFTSSLTGLARATGYHLRAYATNSAGTGYSADVAFTTLADLPTVTTTAAGSITRTTASAGGAVTDDGGATVTARGVAWGASANPTTANAATSDGSGTGTFVSSLTALTAGSTYHLRAYATNSIGTAYGSDVAFTTTSSSAPAVVTAALASITKSSATGGGSVTDDGGSQVTDYGLVWSATNNPPTISDNKVAGSGDSGSFVLDISGLAAKSTYYVRAYATNSVGTGYGNVVTLATLNQFNLPASVAPMITNQWMTFTWPYNAYYPVDTNPNDSGNTNDGHVGNACGPTSLAKTLGYWKVATGSGQIDADDDMLQGIHWTFDLSAMNLDYANMPDTLARTATEAQYKDVATLFEAAGAVGFTHGIGGGSPAETLYPAMAPYFNMSPAVTVLHDWEYTPTDWLHLVEYELSRGRPLIVAGRTPASNDPWVGGGADGHWWNVDGYNSQDQIHATYNFTDYSGNAIAGYFGADAMGPVTIDSGQWSGYTKDHYVIFDFQPQVPATSDPVLETHPANSPTATTARIGGSVLGQGKATLIGHGFHVSASGITAYDVPVGGSIVGRFYTTLTGLQPGTTYTVTAYADSATQRYNGEEQQFTTLASGATPDAVMPLLSSAWLLNTWPYNADLPAYIAGPNGYFFNEDSATSLAKLLYFWRYPQNGTGTFTQSFVWAQPVNLSVDLSTLNLDYTQMGASYDSTATADQYGELAKLIAATETYVFGQSGTNLGSMRAADPDANLVPLLVSSWGLDPGLTLVKQENVSADQWTQLLKTEIAAGRPVLIQGRTSDSVAPGTNGNVNAGWGIVDGYNSSGQFHVDFSAGLYAFSVPDSRGWYDPATLAPSAGYTSYHRALIGFKPASH